MAFLRKRKLVLNKQRAQLISHIQVIARHLHHLEMAASVIVICILSVLLSNKVSAQESSTRAIPETTTGVLPEVPAPVKSESVSRK